MRLLLFIILLSTAVLAQEPDIISKGEITLLALVENGTVQSGSVAVLELEIRPGKERVFLETYPMTKITTQASLRFAQQIACKELDIDCSKYDFLFTIRALPGIVGGPSAGGAATVLTSALLLNKTLDPTMAMTGTINSGGIIGPVGGLKYKLEAASAAGIKTVYVPKGLRAVEFQNRTIGLVEYGGELGLAVREIDTIQEILEQETRIDFPDNAGQLKIDERYSEIMRSVAEDLCNRSTNFSRRAPKNVSFAENLTQRAEEALEKNAHYAAASYCFRANVEYKRSIYQSRNFSQQILERQIKLLQAEAEEARVQADNLTITTLTDLQTYLAVRERIDEAITMLDSSKKNKTIDPAGIGFVEERLFSAKTWSRFFNGTRQTVVIDQEALENSCTAKISEAEERFNYVKSVLPEALDGTRKDISEAYGYLNSGKYSLCLFTASKAKAEADVLLGLMGIEEQRLNDLIDLKLKIARTALMKAQKKGIFPILAYSYYEYAESLKDFDQASSLLFAEYALELANFDIYFHKVPLNDKKQQLDKLAGSYIIPIALIIILLVFLNILRKKSVFSAIGNIKTLQAPPKRRLRGKKR